MHVNVIHKMRIFVCVLFTYKTRVGRRLTISTEITNVPVWRWQDVTPGDFFEWLVRRMVTVMMVVLAHPAAA